MVTTTRRQILRSCTATALAMPFVRPARAEERTVSFMGYSGIFQPSYQQAVMDPFMKAHPEHIVEGNSMGFLSDDGGDTYNHCHMVSFEGVVEPNGVLTTSSGPISKSGT